MESTTVILYDVRPPVSVDISNISAIQLTWAYQDHRTLWVKLDRMDNAESVITFRDKIGKTGSIAMSDRTCTWPPISYEIVYPAEPKQHPFMPNYPELVRFPARFEIAEFPDEPFRMAISPSPPPYPSPFTIYLRSSTSFRHQSGLYRGRLFDDRGNSFTEMVLLREISMSEIPAGGPELPSTSNTSYYYYAFEIRNYQPGETYAVQFVEPTCDSPLAGFVKTPG